jgi:type I restriction enzyme S subunit
MINGDLKKRISERAIDGIPEGWILTTIAEIAELNPPKPSQNALPPHTPVTFVPMPAVDAESGVISRPETRQFSEVRKGYTAFLEGDVIMAKITPCMENGKAAVVRDLENRLGFGSTEFHVLRSNGSVLPEYVYYFIRQQSFRKAAEAEMTGSVGQKRVPGEFLKQAEIQLPPFAEQKRIVTKIEELLARVNSTKERLAKVSMILKRFRQAALAAACSGRLTADWRSTQKELEPADHLLERIRRKYREQYEAECSKAKREGKKLPKKPEILELRKVETAGLSEIPDEWMWIYLPALGHLSRGKSKHRPRNAPDLYGGPYPFIQTGDIAQSRGLITSHQQTYSEAGLAQSHLWPSGTICITIAANIANSALLTYPACFPDSVVGLIPDESLCLKEYAEFFIRIARANLDQYAPATAQKNINIEILSDVAVPLPPIAEQEVIVRRAYSMFKLADAAEKRVAAATARAEKLTQAILAKAFRGEMVPTEAELARRDGRSYEPASVLLARIKSERESKQASQKVRRNRN